MFFFFIHGVDVEAILANASRRQGKRDGERTECVLKAYYRSQLHWGRWSLVSPGDSGSSVTYRLQSYPSEGEGVGEFIMWITG